jgi:tRNA G10  N-methylase Trm11
VTLNDLCYRGGKPIWNSENGDGFYYDPEQNLREYVKLFEVYGDFVSMPNFDKISGYEASDVSRRLPFNDNEFDWVFSDPPYGKSMKTKGCDGLIEYLPEILRVSRNGALLIIPEDWLTVISASGNYKAENLTGTLAHQKTNFKTTLAHVYE